ncbi:Scavenger receptor class F member 1 [Mizuhopecten yessoensis]|uniref:Scavenger receptor class F member 1 n=1 Tax=Mizuhopecten yessoensis TaxID=6573 RepID=A0A210R3K8_MIZYE|nr:Scavenger receptor class F member 1 [Mizuhopecten yessoensis]
MQSSLFSVSSNWTADKVVDGCLKQNIGSDCCTHTAWNRNKALWQVDLGKLSTISYITIYNRDEGVQFPRRLAGYQLYLSNTSDWSQGILCYEDKSNNWTEVEMVVTHRCPYVAKFVTIYNYRNDPARHDWYEDNAVLELCEVQVFGCPIRKYGNGNCNQTCSDKCYGGNCDASTGSCFYCLPGKWSHTCDQDCSSGCEGCIQNGSCTDCVSGKWGDTCDRDCSKNCNDCFQNNESCKDCIRGKHGNSCELYCPTHCANDACDREFGLCIDCKPGKRGETCDLDCPAKCKDLLCEKTTGFCSECMDGMYGYKCEKACPAECGSNKCRRSDGTCEDTDTCTRTDNITVVAVLAAVAALCSVTAIASFVYMLRIRAALKTEQTKATEEHYTGIDMAGRDDLNAYYEMSSPNATTN